MKKALFCLLLLTGLLSLCQCGKEESLCRLYGGVGYTDKDDGNEYAVQGAVVCLYKEGGNKAIRRTTSGADGHFELLVKELGQYEVQASIESQGKKYYSDRVKVYFAQDFDEKMVALFIR